MQGFKIRECNSSDRGLSETSYLEIGNTDQRMKGKETEEDVSKGDIDSAMCLEVWKSVSAEAKEQRL